MTKRDLVKWLEKKHSEAMQKAKDEYLALRMQAKQKLCDSHGFNQAADQIQEHLDKALAIWGDWKNKIDGVEGISCHNGYHSLNSSLYVYTREGGSFYNQALNEEIAVDSAEIKHIEATGKELLKNITRNYTNVIAVVQSFKTTKEAAAYLKELGFDLGELENPPAPVTALAVQINTSYLFINKNAA